MAAAIYYDGEHLANVWIPGNAKQNIKGKVIDFNINKDPLGNQKYINVEEYERMKMHLKVSSKLKQFS